MTKAKIAGLGHFVPERVVTNFDLEKVMDTSDTWIKERTGISERRYFDPEKDTVANMGARASMQAIEQAGIQVKDVDFIILATITPDYFFPGSGVLMQRELGLEGIGALDIRNACSGFIYALSIAEQYVKTNTYKNILVVGAEIQSSALEMNDRGRAVSVIFADGAGAALVQATDDQDEAGILSSHLHADGRFAEELYVKDPGSSRKERLTKDMVDDITIRAHMNGNLVFKHAIVRFQEVINEALQANKLQVSDIDMMIPHQANLRISQFVQKQLGLSDNQVFNNIMRYGNTTAASIPIAMSEAWKQGKLSQGDLLCIAAFGSGFTWASSLIKL